MMSPESTSRRGLGFDGGQLHMNRWAWTTTLVAGAVILAGAARVAAGDDDAAPTTRPAFRDVALPFEQRWFVPYPGYPATRVWRMRATGDLGVYTTAHSIGPESAMLFYQPRGATPGGEILVYDVGALENEKEHDLATYKGVSFWLKGDGGGGAISLGGNWNQTNTNNPRIGTFPLAERKWTKHFVPWAKFARPPGPGGFYYVNVKLEPASDRACWAVLTRLSLYKDEKTEPVEPPADVSDPPGLIPAERFVEPGVAEAQQRVAKTIAKLKARQPVTVVVTGDSITAGAQLWYMNEEGSTRVGDSAIYFAVLERALARHYGYADGHHRAVFKKWIFPDKKKDPAAEEHFEIITGEPPAADSSLVFDGLQVIGVGAGGKDSRFGESHLADLTQFKPDLVVWAYGANDSYTNRGERYTEPSLRVIRTLKEQGVEVIVAVPTPWLHPPMYEYSLAFRDLTRQIGRAADVPVVDQLSAFLARGDRYRGDLLSDIIHPNEHGHEIMAATLAAALGVPDQHVWDRPLFRARSAGAKIPD
jgi:hypothetical protein